MAKDNGGVGNSKISPTSDQTKQGASYGYPGERSGASGAELAKPATRTNGKLGSHR